MGITASGFAGSPGFQWKPALATTHEAGIIFCIETSRLRQVDDGPILNNRLVLQVRGAIAAREIPGTRTRFRAAPKVRLRTESVNDDAREVRHESR